MFTAIANILGPALSIWQHENAVRYLKQLHKLETAYDKENDKEESDHNVLDRIERDLLRLSHLVASEIGRPKANTLQD